jgi:hypothetical protein
LDIMSQHWAMTWTVKPGVEQDVEELFRNYGTPEHVFRDGDGNEVGRLISTQVFMKDNRVVRVMEFEGDHRTLVAHLQQQPAVRELERKLDDYLEVPRDMSTPEGAQKFFREAGMRCLLSRRGE